MKIMDERQEAETYFMRYIIDAYFIMGRPDKALERLRAFIPSVMKSDCSTLWEHRNHKNSSNHAWSGHGIIHAGQRIAGIEPIKPGFKEFSVRPQLASLTHVEAGMETSYGMIEVVFDRKGKRINAAITVPQGTTAVVSDARGREQRLGAGTHRLSIR